MIQDKLGLDNKDMKILSLYIDNPNISQNEIATKLKMSQPSINMRIKKLKKKGVLQSYAGIEFNKSGLFLTRVDFTAKNANNILNSLKVCPFFVNGFIMSGRNNVSVFFVSEDLGKTEEIVNKHLRANEEISDINVNIVVKSAKDFVFTPSFVEDKSCGKCATCKKT